MHDSDLDLAGLLAPLPQLARRVRAEQQAAADEQQLERRRDRAPLADEPRDAPCDVVGVDQAEHAEAVAELAAARADFDTVVLPPRGRGADMSGRSTAVCRGLWIGLCAPPVSRVNGWTPDLVENEGDRTVPAPRRPVNER